MGLPILEVQEAQKRTAKHWDKVKSKRCNICGDKLLWIINKLDICELCMMQILLFETPIQRVKQLGTQMFAKASKIKDPKKQKHYRNIGRLMRVIFKHKRDVLKQGETK